MKLSYSVVVVVVVVIVVVVTVVVIVVVVLNERRLVTCEAQIQWDTAHCCQQWILLGY